MPSHKKTAGKPCRKDRGLATKGMSCKPTRVRKDGRADMGAVKLADGTVVAMNRAKRKEAKLQNIRNLPGGDREVWYKQHLKEKSEAKVAADQARIKARKSA